MKDPALADETLLGNIRRAIETHAEMTSYLTLLLATLGIMIGLFTVTGFINRMGAMLLDLGAWNIIAMIVMAWIFGWLAGAGLPPTATYIIGAVVIVRPMQELGINPWVAHFFVFLLSVWGELSPPTSLTAAVSARIANASFLKTMYEALKICAPITLMTFAIFTRSNMVVNPGWLQIADTMLVLISTLRHHLRDVRPLPRHAGRRYRVAMPAGGGLVRGDVPSGHVDVGADRRAGRGRAGGRHPAASADCAAEVLRARRPVRPVPKPATLRRCWPKPSVILASQATRTEIPMTTTSLATAWNRRCPALPTRRARAPAPA